MPSRFYRYCYQRGCTERHNHVSGYCEKHRLDNANLRIRKERDSDRKKNDPIWKLYYCADWGRFKLTFAGSGNAVCQRIVDGQRCTRPIEIHHHIISPKERRELMYTLSNVVGVCRQHHPNTEGEPKQNLCRLAEIYVPTLCREIKF
jgi:hypothetical protein